MAPAPSCADNQDIGSRIKKNDCLFHTTHGTIKRLNLLDHDLSIPGGDFLTHLDDTYEGAGEHDGLVIAVALVCWWANNCPMSSGRTLPI